MKLAELTQIAMLGTERQPLKAWPGGNPLANLLTQLEVSKREQALLSAAALATVFERSGALPAKDASQLPAACVAEELPRANGHAGSLLRRLLEGDHPVLLSEWLSLATQRQQLAPPELLPALLELGVKQREARESILPVLGKRGRWLAEQNPEWVWSEGAEADEGIWQTGEKPARLLFLRQLRRREPARALALLSETWKAEAPDDRAAFIAELETGLSPGDEAFLEAALDDKRKEVRMTAANWLKRLPESALVRRMEERAQRLLKYAPGETGSLLKLKKKRAAMMEVTLPAVCDKAMQRDGIEQKPPQGFGEKAGWLLQLLEGVPLSFWIQQWKTTPADILAASLDGEWKKELFEAWTRAAVLQQNAEWAMALLAAAVEGKRFDKFESLLSALPPAQRESCVQELLKSDDKKTEEIQSRLIELCQHQWGENFSRAVIAWMRSITEQPSGDWQLRNQLKNFAAWLAPSMLRHALSGWPTSSRGWDFWSKGVEEFMSVAQFRLDMHAAFTEK